MDLAVYIGELLRQQGKLNVPGLGLFSQVRKDGYYRDDRSIFHPPHYETSFEEQASDDSTLASYLSERKKISVASATYFVEKYINNLKQQATETDVTLDQLGWMRLQDNKLIFKPNAASVTFEQEYFGLPALSVNKIWDQLSGFRKTPHVVEEPVATEAPVVTAAASTGTSTPVAPVAEPTPAPTPELAMFPEVLNLREEKPEPTKLVKPKRLPESKQVSTPTEDTMEAAEPKTAINIWILVLIIVTVAAIILLALYQYKPALFSRRATPQQVTVKQDNDDTSATVKKADTIQTSLGQSSTPAAVAATTPANTNKATTTAAAVTHPATAPVSQPANTPAETLTPQQRFEIMGGAFGNLKQAQQAIAAYKKVGVIAHIYENVPGRKVKLTLGTYPSYDEATMHLHHLQAAGKATKDAYVQRPK